MQGAIRGQQRGRARVALLTIGAVFAAACTTAAPPPATPVVPVSTISGLTCDGPFTAAKADTAVSADSPAALDGDALMVVVAEAVEEVAAGTGAPPAVVVTTVDGGGRPSFHPVAPEAAPRRAAALAAAPGLDVVDVEALIPVRATSTWTATDQHRSKQWSFNRLEFEVAWACGKGAGVDIAVVDTGVDGTHPDLAGRVAPGVAFTFPLPDLPGGGATDVNGHGTHVASIAAAGTGNGVGIAGVAPEARILPVRALGADGTGTVLDIAKGIVWAVDNGAEVVNLSLGADAASSMMTTAVEYATNRGVVVVAAAGNSGPTGAPMHPAADPRTIAVASVDSTLNVSGFSTHGTHVDVAAPGGGIYGAIPNNSWSYLSGTSQATPHVAGVVALLRAINPGGTPTWVRTRIEGTARDIGPAGVDTSSGYGLLQPAKAVGARISG